MVAIDGIPKTSREQAAPKRGLALVQTTLWAVLGYAVPLALVCISVCGLCWILWLAWDFYLGVLGLGAFFYLLLRIVAPALWVRIKPPEGIELDRKQYAAVYKEADEICKRLRAPRIAKILISPRFQASMHTVPRLGVIGWHRSYLLLGMPLLLVLSPDQIHALLAHEVAHSSRESNHFSNWVYRTQMTWIRITERIEMEGQGGALELLNAFARWYLPRLNEHSMTVCRYHELEADRCSALVVGPMATASMLFQVHIYGLFLEREIQPMFDGFAKKSIAPPKALYRFMATEFEERWSEEKARIWLEEALSAGVDAHDSHPPLSERYAVLHIPISASEFGREWFRKAKPERPTAAEALFGSALPDLEARVQHLWWQKAQWDWKKTYNNAAKSRLRLDGLQRQVKIRELSVDELWERAQLVDHLDGFETAQSYFKEVLCAAPNHAEANLAEGSRLLQVGDESGLEFIQKAIESDRKLGILGYLTIRAFFDRIRETDRGDAYLEQLTKAFDLFGVAAREKSELGPRDELEPHGLTEVELATIRRRLMKFKCFQRAYLVRKNLKRSPGETALVLGIVLTKEWANRGLKSSIEVHDEIEAAKAAPPGSVVLILDRSQRRTLKAIRRIPASQVV